MSAREMADEVREKMTTPLQQARDHAHWLAVHRRVPVAALAENVIEAALRMAYVLEGQVARNEIPDRAAVKAVEQVESLVDALDDGLNDVGGFGVGYAQALEDVREQIKLRFGEER